MRRGGNLPPETGSDKPHDRVKNYIIKEGSDVPPLTDLGVFTKKGKVAAPMQDKFRQINRFLEMIGDVLPESAESFNVIDYGCGKSYLTFVMYYYLTAIKGYKNVRVTGVDQNPGVIETSNAAAKKYGYGGLGFVQGEIAGWDCAGADMALALHACDTATDYALANAVCANVKYIFVSPCCQHEVNGQMKAGEQPFGIITRYGIAQERIAAVFTDIIRANLLASRGYRTNLMEFVDLTHTPKNLLIRGVKTKMPQKSKQMYLDEVNKLCETFNIEPLLKKLLQHGNGNRPPASDRGVII